MGNACPLCAKFLTHAGVRLAATAAGLAIAAVGSDLKARILPRVQQRVYDRPPPVFRSTNFSIVFWRRHAFKRARVLHVFGKQFHCDFPGSPLTRWRLTSSGSGALDGDQKRVSGQRDKFVPHAKAGTVNLAKKTASVLERAAATTALELELASLPGQFRANHHRSHLHSAP